MARWYSKRHKAKITADFKRYGYIPPYGEIMRYAMAPHNHVSDLEKCAENVNKCTDWNECGDLSSTTGALISANEAHSPCMNTNIT